MTEFRPDIRSANQDTNGPAKKRRRPALSCVECRVRKVKCDRKKPCAVCTRIGSETCTYRPTRPGIRTRSPAMTSVSASGSNEQTLDETRQCLTGDRSALEGVEYRGYGASRSKARMTDRANTKLNSPEELGTSTTVEHLLERIRNLERRNSRPDADGCIGRTDTDGLGPTNGQFIKSKFYGQSHWMNAIEPYEALGDSNTTVNVNTNRREVNKKTELYTTIVKLKQMARIIKTSRLIQPSIPIEVQDSIPPKEVCDVLVNCYLRTFEGTFRVLHIPSFRQEYARYWGGEQPGKLSVLFKILLVCAIGATFYTGSDQPVFRTARVKWIQAAANWLGGPHIKSRLNMAGLQIHILILLARQICNIDGDHVWISAGSLLRTAMHLGLHRDPEHFSKISVFHCEMRRRLWATVLEITAQSSLDMGMPSMITVDDYDTKPPSNIDDEDIGEGHDGPVESRPLHEFTNSSMQIASTETLPLRLRMIKLLNSLRFNLQYNDVLELGKELIDACNKQIVFLRSALNISSDISPFQIKLADSLVRRFVLCLHRPYFMKAKENPQYHYSRKICLDTSLAILAPATEPDPGEEDDWTSMSHRSVGFVKSIFVYAMSTVYMELVTQITELKQCSSIYTPIPTNPSTPSTTRLTLPAHITHLLTVLTTISSHTFSRLQNGETNPKGAVFMACALARIDALISNKDPGAAVLEAAKESVSQIAQILVKVYQAEHGVPIDLSGKGQERNLGDGADDVTGRRLQTGTDAVVRGTEAVGSEADMSIHLENGGGEGHGGVDGLAADWGVDLDFDAYMTGGSFSGAESVAGYHFGRSPEWFYDVGEWAGGVDMGLWVDGL